MDFSLKAIFGLDATGVKTEIRQLTRETRNFVNQWGKIGAGAATAALIAFSKSAMDLAGSLNDTAQNLDINVEALQALQAQHKLNGVSAEQFTKTMEKTKGAVISAASGNEKAVEALAKLGLSAEKLIRLPLEEQYFAIAQGATNASDQTQAFAAVSQLLGEKVGPKLIGSMRELAGEGLPAVIAAAKETGRVMSAETVVALDRAGDAIDDFKTRATVALGNIIVNFRSEEGLKLLWYQLSDVVLRFTAGIVDAITYPARLAGAVFSAAFGAVVDVFRNGLVDAAIFAAKAVNKILPDGFDVDVAGLEKLKTAGVDFADRINRAIADTNPTALRDTLGEATSALVAEQQKVVDQLNRVDLGEEADKLRAGGKDAGQSVEVGAKAIEKAGTAVAADIEEAADEMAVTVSEAFDDGLYVWKDGIGLIKESIRDDLGGMATKLTQEMGAIVAAWQGMNGSRFEYLGARGADQFNSASDDALDSIARRNRQTANELRNNGQPISRNYDNRMEAGRLEIEAANAEAELKLRRNIRNAYNSGGTSAVYRANPNMDPIALDRLIQQFAQQQDSTSRTASAIERIETGLRRKKLIPTT